MTKPLIEIVRSRHRVTPLFRGSDLIAFAVMTGKNAREGKGALSKIPVPGFFRVTTSEENLDAIFLALFAIGRTDMNFYR